ncbi:MAG TPA: hypothetical protein DCX19_01315 [Alphaproteobacteria bacterium]|nr:hypothetical protein [Alphaproteobacteria bacterium]
MVLTFSETRIAPKTRGDSKNVRLFKRCRFPVGNNRRAAGQKKGAKKPRVKTAGLFLYRND